MKSLSLYLMAVVFLVSACASPDPASYRETDRYDRLYSQIASIQSDADVAQFLADEAYVAGVQRIVFTNSTAFYGRASTDGTVTLSKTLPGGTGVVNITHEIAHVAAKSTVSCGCHTRPWLLAYREIAKRFEERFPGRTWSGVTPTQRVDRNISRYNIKV